MRTLRLVAILFFASTVFFSCQKDPTDFTSNVSVGTLKKSAAGNCLPITVNGTFQVGNPLDNNSYIDVQLSVTSEGTFDITTDTINGYSFGRTGGVGRGLHTIRLYAKGNPVNGGTNNFTVKYGTSTCSFNVLVSGGTILPAVYSLGAASGACTGFALAGTYTAGTALASSNTVTLTVNVAVPGSYSISTTAVNGITFSASGNFSATGTQNVVLTGSGTPAAGGTFTVTVTGSSNTCSFPLTVVSPAAYTLGGAGGNCTGYVLSGIYAEGITLTSANTAVIDVNVTAIGGYNISSTTVNGIKFSASGNFTVVGPQTVTLTGTGTPTAGVNLVFPVTGGATTCSISLSVSPTPASVYTINCAGITVNGTYFVGSALGASNSIVVPVNVTGIGTYTITTLPAVNGISFSKNGVFTTTGTQSITLTGTGTPVAAGPFNYTVTGASGTCPGLSITATAGVPAVFTCKIDGVFTSFSQEAKAELTFNLFGTTETFLAIEGRLLPFGNPSDDYSLFISKPGGGNIPAGAYDQNTFMNSLGV
ncbi:MAG TPA: hypothetical protein VK484_10620, partial [Ferruginibacter sp.]|nr:hypothetical protein [Ferruginibacter sp.]